MDHKFKKGPGAKETYSRLKQKMIHEPTEVQIERWEYEGGTVPREADQGYSHTLSLSDRFKHFAEKVWRLFHKPQFGN